MLLKASSITNLTDARYFAAKEVQYLGFNLEEGTPGYLDPMYMKAIREWVAGPHIVGEYQQLPTSHIAAAAEFFGLDVVQLSAAAHLDALSSLPGLEIILHLDGSLSPQTIEHIFHEAAPYVHCFLLDCSKTPDWESLLMGDTDFWNELLGLRPTLLQADIAADQIQPLFQRLNFAGLSLVGGEEEQVGVKSFDDIDLIFDALEV
jgi:phosphoribosylanthranilate isomerase